MNHSPSELTSPVEGWGENLHRLLERAATTEFEDDDDYSGAARVVQRRGKRPVVPVANVTRRVEPPPRPPAKPTAKRSAKSSTDPSKKPPAKPDADTATERISRALPAGSLGEQMPQVTSAFEVYSEPILSANFAAYPTLDYSQQVEPVEYAGYASGSESTGEPTGTGSLSPYRAASDQIVLYAPVNSNARPDSPGDSPIDAVGPLTYVRRSSARMSSHRIHPAVSMASISSDDSAGPSSLPDGIRYGESIRSAQSTPPGLSLFTPPVSPKRPTINTNYTRPLSPEGVPMQTPVVEVGPSLSVKSVPKFPPKSPPPPYGGLYGAASPAQSVSPTATSPTNRRTHSFYALADARSDQIFSNSPTQPTQPPPHPALRQTRSTSAVPPLVQHHTPPIQQLSPPIQQISPPMQQLSPPMPQVETGSARTSTGSPSWPPFTEPRSHPEFTIVAEDPDGSAFAPRPPTASETPPATNYHRPQEHTARPAPSPEPPAEPPTEPPTEPPAASVRRKPVPLKKSVTDTFKETVPVPSARDRHDSLKEVTPQSARHRHLSDGSDYRTPRASAEVPRVTHIAEHRAMTFDEDMSRRMHDNQYKGFDFGPDVRQRQLPPLHTTYVDTSKEYDPRPVANVQIAPSPQHEPQSHLEMIRQKNKARKRGHSNTLRVTNW